MKCNLEWLSAYLDGVLAEDKRAKLEEHLKTCEACTAKLEEFARVEQTAKKIPAPQLSEAYWENFASRVQNKLTIREKQKSSPGWLEALKSFFQPTTGKLAIAGGVAVIILLTFISLDQWKKETFRPPVFEDERPVAEGKTDSVQAQPRDESEFRTAEKDNKAGLVEGKRLDQPARERGRATLSQKPAENVPAASAPVGKMLAAPEGQESREEPSLAGYVERDDAIEGDTVLVTAGRKAEIRKEVATSQVKVAAEEIEKLPAQRGISAPYLGIRSRVPTDKEKIKEDSTSKSITSDTNIREYTLIKGGFDVQNEISKNERMLSDSLHRDSLESLYVLLGKQYLQLYRVTLKSWDWNKANRRIKDFLKKELSDSTRQRLSQIQAELKKLKK